MAHDHIERMQKAPADEGAKALEPILEWYAMYKHLRRHNPNVAEAMTVARLWLWTRLKAAFDLEDAVDPIVSDTHRRSR